MPPKRSAASAALAEKEEDNKKLRTAIDQASIRLPRTTSAPSAWSPLELPVDPVTAEDGRIYERTEIQRHRRREAKFWSARAADGAVDDFFPY